MTHRAARIALLGPAALAGGLALALSVHRPGLAGQAGAGIWFAAALVWLAATLAARDLAALTPRSPTGRRAVGLACRCSSVSSSWCCGRRSSSEPAFRPC